MGLKFTRVFTTDGEHPYDQVDWEYSDVKIGNSFYQEAVEFPTTWSERARKIVASKYFYGDLGSEKREFSLKNLIDRVVNTIVEEGWIVGYFDSPSDKQIFKDELTYILLHQIATFNSPVWFNIGVEGVLQQASACFINSVEDNMDDILDLAKTEGRIFKRGSGAGVNLSKLRGEGEPLSGGGTASGPVSFMKGWDAFAGVIKSGGVTRRAAKMIILDADHPDIYEFINCKLNEEKKAHTLIDAGYDSAIDGEAYSSIFFQNANHSIRVTDDFMCRAVGTVKPKEYPINYRVSKGDVTVAAEEVLSRAAQVAWECGDPGIMFGDEMQRWNTCKESGEIIATNPCGEYIWLNDTSCNLASINLLKSGRHLPHIVQVMITAMDILCGFADYPTNKIKHETLKYRTLGLGYSNLGALLMSQGIPYDSDEGRKLAANITATMTGEAYLQSTRIARALKPFPEWEKNSGSMIEVIMMHKDALPTQDAELQALWSTVKTEGFLWGFRNAQVTVIAPTGTISFMMDCETTGIEPLIALESTKSLVGGGEIDFEIPVCALMGLDKLTPGDERKVLESDPVFATAIGETNTISPEGHIKMVAAVQPFLSGGVSKTINMPTASTWEDVYDIYVKAWQLGLKNISIYRDGSKRSQPLQAKKKIKPRDAVKKISIRKKMGVERDSITHSFNIAGHKGYLTVGLYEDGSPGEIFVTMAKEGSTLSGLMDAFATMVSFGLQHGIPLEFMVEKLSGARYEPSGFTGNPDVPHAKSITDYIFKWLEHKFLSNKENSEKSKVDSSAPFCSQCNVQMVLAGVCHTCPECGEVSGGCG